MTGRRYRPRGDGGSATLELAITAPALLLLLALVVVGGRIQVAAGAVEHAAAAAAREASLARTPAAARAAAEASAARELAGQDLHCVATSLSVDTAGFASRLGQPATVSTALTCTVSFADLAVPGLPGSRVLEGSATSTLDRFRARS